MAQPFDVQRLAVAGEAMPIAEQIQTMGSPYSGIFSASPDGVLAYQTGSAVAGSQIAWVDRAGKVVAAAGDRASYGDLELSPDARRAAVTVIDATLGSRDIWIVDLARGLRSRLTFDAGEGMSGIWSPDGARLAFASNRNGAQNDIYLKASTGTGTDDLMVSDGPGEFPTSWSPDGQFVLYSRADPSTRADLWVVPTSGDRKPAPFLKTPFNEGMGQFSPDGGWVAYVSDESARAEVYVVPFRGASGKWMVSAGGGRFPRWRRDGREIFYWSLDGRLIAAAVGGQGAVFEVGQVQPLFEVRAGGPRNFYDVSPDGKRFLVNMPSVVQAAPAPVTVVVNWAAAVKK